MSHLEEHFEPFLQYCLLQRRLAASSVANYRMDLHYFQAFLDGLAAPGRDCGAVDRKVLELYLAHLSSKYKVRTIKRKMSCVQSLFNYLEQQEVVESKAPAVQHLNSAFFWCRDVAILELLFAVGLRVAELCSLRFEDIDIEAGVFPIHGKGNRERILHVADPEGVRNLVDKYAKAAGIRRRVTPHVFRHSFATLLIESGVDIKYVQDFLGHSSISTTQIYLHLSEESKRQVLAAHHPRARMDI